MGTKYYADSTTGAYLGGVDEVYDAPANSVETTSAPEASNQVWNGTAWTGTVPPSLRDDTDALAFQLLYHNAPWELFSLFPLFKFYGDVPASRMGCWAIIKGQSPAWLTSEWINNMESYCAANNMPLVP